MINKVLLKKDSNYNIGRVLNIIFEKYNAKDTAMLAVDACQAFDGIEWKHL